MKHWDKSYILQSEILQRPKKDFQNITHFGSAKLHFGHSEAPGKLFYPIYKHAAIRESHWTQTLIVQANNR